jgi:hypothetical protein
LTKNTAFKKAKLKTFYFLLNAATEIPWSIATSLMLSHKAYKQFKLTTPKHAFHVTQAPNNKHTRTKLSLCIILFHSYKYA